MSNESQLWSIVKTKLQPFGSLERIENKLREGIPDVNFALTHPPTGRTVSGWCELKNIAAWPVRPATPLHIPHLKLEQVEWMEQWNGLVFMLLRVGNTFMVHTPLHVRAIYERRYTAQQVAATASVIDRGRFPTGDLLRWLVKETA